MGKARKLRREEAGISKPKQPSRSISQWVWSETPSIFLFVLGAAVNFMTSGHPYIADMFFVAGTLLFLFRFFSWEIFKKHEKRKFIYLLPTLICLVVLGATMYGNHYLYNKAKSEILSVQPKQPPSKEAKLPPTTAELEQNLREQIQFLRLSSEYFDRGMESEGKRIASTLHILFVDTEDCPSLLEQMRIRDEIQLPNTANYDEKGNLVPYTGLVGIKFNPGKKPSFIAKCLIGGQLRGRVVETLPFKEWWKMVILNNRAGLVFTRESLVIAVAQQDGGIKVASGLDPSYVELARKRGAGWSWRPGNQRTNTGASVSLGEGKPILGVELHSIREIAWEVIEAISKRYPQYLSK